MFSGLIDPSPRVSAGSTPLQPTTRAEFRVRHGKKSAAQRLLGGLGRRMDQAKEPSIPKPAARYHPHNCLPWRNDNCVSCPLPTHNPDNLAPAVHPPTSQRQPFSAGSPTRAVFDGTSPNMQWHPTNQGPSFPGGFIPTIPTTAQWQPTPAGPLSARSLATAQNPHSPQWQPTNPSPTPLRTAEAVQEKVYHSLLHYFCEGGGDQASEKQKRDHTMEIIQRELRAPILLRVPHSDTEKCDEFSRISKAVEGCLEMMQIRGITLVPELSDNGRELVVHIFS
jgi:hypothetical protein